MIRLHANEFVVGSEMPVVQGRVKSMTMRPEAQSAIDSYVRDEAWTIGENFLIQGGPLAGKTSTGLYLLRSIAQAGYTVNWVYWTEADYHADLRNLWRYESLVEKSANDTPLWTEYTEWERSFWDLKESPLLFLDDLGRGHTPNQRYEIESLLRRRRDMGLPTIVGAETSAWDAVPATVKALFKEGQHVVLEAADARR